MLFTLIWLVLAFVLLPIPLIGPIAWWVMTPVLYGGYLLAARELEHGRTPVVRHLFQGLLEKDQRRRLLTIGVVTLPALVILFMVLGAGSQMGAGAINPDDVMSLAEWLNLFLRALLVAMVSGVSGMGLIYSSPLVLFTPIEGIEAVMTSFEACWNNWRVVLAFFGVFMVLALGAVLTLGLGFLVVMPVAYCASYQSYKSLFAEPEGVLNLLRAGFALRPPFPRDGFFTDPGSVRWRSAPGGRRGTGGHHAAGGAPTARPPAPAPWRPAAGRARCRAAFLPLPGADRCPCRRRAWARRGCLRSGS